MTFLFHINDRWRRASDVIRYAAMPSHVLIATVLAIVTALCGCASTPMPRHEEYAFLTLRLSDESNAPLATIHVIVPSIVSSNWSEGYWHGELSPTYVRPKEQVLFASDLLKVPPWGRLICRLDPDNAAYRRMILQPDSAMDHITVCTPLDEHSSEESWWYHWTDAGEPESGAAKVLGRQGTKAR
jgi:hypothetical protein